MTAPPPATRRRRATRARLLDAAATVFAERGLGRTSIEEVCEAAGFTRGAFYSNFASLDELFFALYEQRAGRVAEQVANALAGPGERTIPALVERVVSALSVDREWTMIKAEYFLHAARHPDAAAALQRHRHAVVEALVPALRDVVDLTALPGKMRTPHTLARAVVTVHDGSTLDLLLDPDPDAHRQWLRALLTALLEGRD
ncbi:MAG: helix-turn-helix domain-containing protein [Nakamurella sp.]